MKVHEKKAKWHHLQFGCTGIMFKKSHFCLKPIKFRNKVCIYTHCIYQFILYTLSIHLQVLTVQINKVRKIGTSLFTMQD